MKKSLFHYGKRSYQPKYHSLRWKIVTSSLKTKQSVVLYKEKKSKNGNKKRRNENFEKQKMCPKDHLAKKLGS